MARVLSYQVAEHVSSGRLVTILDRFELPGLPVQIVHREGLRASGKVRSFVDFAVDRLRMDTSLK